VKCFIISNNTYIQDAVNSMCEDLAHTTMSLATYGDVPISTSGDLKTPGWSYCTNIQGVYGCANGPYIKDVFSYRVSDRANQSATFLLSILDFEFEMPRFTHV